MKANLKEPDDKAVEGANKAASGCGLVMAGVSILIVIYSLWVLFSL